MSRFFILAILLISLELHDCFRHFKGHTTYVSRTYLSSKSKGKNESKSKDVFKDVTKLIGGLSKGTINKENYNKEVKAKQELYNKQKLAEEYQLKLSTVIGVSLFGFALGLATDLAFIGTVNFLIPPLSLASILGGGIFYALDQNQLPELTDFAKNEIGIPTKDFIEEKKNNIVEFTTLKKQQIKDLPNYIKMIIVQFFEDLKANIKAKVDNKVAEVKQLPNNLKLSAQNKVLETKESFKAGLENVKKIPQNILIGIQNKAKETQEQIAIKTNENIEEIKKIPGQVSEFTKRRLSTLKEDLIAFPGYAVKQLQSFLLSLANSIKTKTLNKIEEVKTETKNKIDNTKSKITNIVPKFDKKPAVKKEEVKNETK